MASPTEPAFDLGVRPSPQLEEHAHRVGAWLAELVRYGTLADVRVRHALCHGELADLLAVLYDANPTFPMSHRIPRAALDSVRRAVADHPAYGTSGLLSTAVYARASAAYGWLTPAYDTSAPLGCPLGPETPA